MNVLRILKTLNRETSADVFLAGKYLRNTLRKKKHAEKIEVVIKHMEFKDVKKWLQKHGKVKFSNNAKSTLVFITNGDTREVIVRLPRKGHSYSPLNKLKDDALTGKFTFDSMYLPIKSKMLRANVMDYFGGLKDIQNKRIRVVGNKQQITVKNNPIVMLEAIALSGELKYKIDSNLFYAIKAYADEIENANMNNIRKLFIQILLSDKPSKQLKLMHDTGLLMYVLPELDMCFGVTQNKRYHKHDVFTHSVLSCDNAVQDLNIRLASLLHDIGKVQARKEEENGEEKKITFYKHEAAGAKLAKQALKRFGFKNDVIKPVCSFVYLHMYNYEPEKWTDAAVKRFIVKAGITEKDLKDISNFPLFLIRRAERMSHGQNIHAVSIRQQLFEERIREIYPQTNISTIEELRINGTDIIEVFNLKPGPTIGNILKHLAGKIEKDTLLNKKETLIELTKEYLSEALK